MTMDLPTFRQRYPEFQTAPDSDVGFWLNLGMTLLNALRWGNTLNFGLGLFIAHNLALDAQHRATADVGGVPGTNARGPVASKSINGVSVSYDTGSVIEAEAGHWNLTVYGQRFIRLARMAGAGPIQVI